ncbi:hypothetical protein HY622_03720 [Candidatus Uhrbacteria bacterium]|nr:hypothetical protein [Candidatus Uhrbacteria bacterium]
MKLKLFTWLFFVFVILYATALHTAATFNDPDSFYHARITELMIEKRGILTEFPWLPFTAFSQSFIDHHLAYHLFLIPFIALWGGVWGIKVATVVAFVAVIAAVYALLAHLLSSRTNPKRQMIVLLFTASLFFNDIFILRMNLEKIPAVSLLWLLGGTYAILAGKRRLVFFFSFFFVWLHGAWPLLPILALLYWLADRGSRHSFAIAAATSVLGASAGLIINPYFPQNISFYFVQIFQVAVVTYDNLFEVGSEWYPAGANIIAWGTGATMLSVVATVVFVFKKAFAKGTAGLSHRTSAERFFFLATLMFFLLTLKSSRHGEYFVPFATIFGALVVTPFLETRSTAYVKKLLLAYYQKKRLAAVIIAAFFAAYLLITPLKSVFYLITFRVGIPVEKHRYTAKWLQENTPPGSIIFNDRWGYFPSLWFWGEHNRFIAGLDPTFFYSRDPELFWRYEALRNGAIQKGAARSIQKKFGVNVIIVSKENSALRAVLNRDPDASLAYEDGSGAIFTVSTPRP